MIHRCHKALIACAELRCSPRGNTCKRGRQSPSHLLANKRSYAILGIHAPVVALVPPNERPCHRHAGGLHQVANDMDDGAAHVDVVTVAVPVAVPVPVAVAVIVSVARAAATVAIAAAMAVVIMAAAPVIAVAMAGVIVAAAVVAIAVAVAVPAAIALSMEPHGFGGSLRRSASVSVRMVVATAAGRSG